MAAYSIAFPTSPSPFPLSESSALPKSPRSCQLHCAAPRRCLPAPPTQIKGRTWPLSPRAFLTAASARARTRAASASPRQIQLFDVTPAGWRRPTRQGRQEGRGPIPCSMEPQSLLPRSTKSF